jgi:hypothetical protein
MILRWDQIHLNNQVFMGLNRTMHGRVMAFSIFLGYRRSEPNVGFQWPCTPKWV